MRLRSRRTLSAAALACAVSACQLVLGIEERPLRDEGTTDATRVPPDGAPPGARDGYAAAVEADAPLAWFRFEDEAGPAAANEIPSSPVSALLSAASVTRGVPGVAGSRAVRLDDTKATITLSGLVQDLGRAHTLELWLRVQTVASGPLAAHMDDPSNVQGARSGRWITIWRDGLQFRTETWSKGSFLSYTLGRAPLPQAAWVHVALGFDPETKRDFAFVDGAASSGGAQQVDVIRPVVAAPFTIVGWLGEVDEIAVYDKALPPARIAAHVSAGFAP